MHAAAQELPRDHARDANDVEHRAEVAGPCGLRIERRDRHGAAAEPVPRRSDQELALEHEPAPGSVLPLALPEERRGGRPAPPPDPEAGAPVREVARPRRRIPSERSGADDDLAGVRPRFGEQGRDLLGRVLAVAVGGDHAGGAPAQRRPHAPPQARPPAADAVAPAPGPRGARGGAGRALPGRPRGGPAAAARVRSVGPSATTTTSSPCRAARAATSAIVADSLYAGMTAA